jgi:lysophospholipase L1-like esterase
MRKAVAALAGLVACATFPAGAEAAPRWIAAWGASPTGDATGGPANATVRNLVRVSLGGTRVRIRVANALSGDTPLVIGGASIALAKGPADASLVAGTSRPITFDGGKPGITLAPKTPYVYSDPVDFPVRAQQDLAISLFLPAATEPGALAATWNMSFVTADGAGDRTRAEAPDGFAAGPSSAGGSANGAPLNCDGCATYALTAVDVFTEQATGAVVGLASSTFHGYNSTPDAWNTVLNDLSVRINHELPFGRQKGIVNAGIGGDTLHAGLERAERDVYSQSGVSAVIPYDLNDIAPQSGRTAEQVIADYRRLIRESHARAIRVLCSTWPPESTDLGPDAQAARDEINRWVLNSGECDDTIDWDRVVRDPNAPLTYKPEYTSGSDTIHPNAAGHKAMADAVPMTWFAEAPAGPSLGLPAPSPRGCASRRSFVIHLRAPHGQRLRSARVFVDGREVRVLRGRALRARVDLRGLPRTVARVTIFARTRDGRSLVQTRAYRTCVA